MGPWLEWNWFREMEVVSLSESENLNLLLSYIQELYLSIFENYTLFLSRHSAGMGELKPSALMSMQNSPIPVITLII